MNQSNRLALLATSSLVALVATANALASFSVEAAAGTFEPDTGVTLARHDIDRRNSFQIFQATAEPDGSLNLQIEEEAGAFVLNVAPETTLWLAPSEGEKIVLSSEDGALVTHGSPGSTALQAYEAFRKESLARLVYPARGAIRQAGAEGADEARIARLTQAEVDAYQEHLKELNDFVIENAGDTLALYGTSLRWDGDYRGDELEQLVVAFAERHGDIAATRSLQTRIEIQKSTRIGAAAPSLEGNNLSGETESLEDYRGRYVLVDFWASWCPPCRIENRNYRQIAERVPPSKFTIFAVNLDTSADLWSRAVKQDSANWVHISDLKGWNSSLASSYGVSSLPASFLLDPEGRIIAKDLRGEVLEAKLKELGAL